VRIDEIILDLPAQLAKINLGYNATIEFEDLPEEEDKLVVYGNKPCWRRPLKMLPLMPVSIRPTARPPSA
jgi:hypothetical protein